MTFQIVQHQHLNIAGISIAQDQEGRFCLNDLHKASGNEERHVPGYFLDNHKSKELVSELETTGIPVFKKTGRNGGTYVCKELVYAYAMWISAKFHLQVIRTFDAVATGDIEKAQRITKPKSNAASMDRNRDARTLKLTADTAIQICAMFPHLSAEAKQVITSKMINAAAGIEIVPLPALEYTTYSAGEVGTRIGISGNMVGRIANINGLKTEKYGRFVLDKSASSDKQVESFRYNDAGVKRLAELAQGVAA